MPLYEYVCSDCSHGFEELVFGDAKPACPKCGSPHAKKHLSVVTVGGSKEPGCDLTGGPCGGCGSSDGPGSCGMAS